jgi:predicted RecA/RadA family phage recombinase
MATNFIQEGRKMNLIVTAGYDSGDPEVIGSLHGVLLTDADSSNKAGVDLGPAVYDLSVKAVNDSGNVAVAIGDAIYFTRADTPKLNKKGSGAFFGIALETIDSGSTATINVLVLNANIALGGIVNALIADDTIRQTKLDRDFIFEEFESNPVTAKVAGGAASGTGGHQNVMLFEDNAFEYSPKGTQTITAPSLAAGGLDVGMDQTEMTALRLQTV